MTPIRYHLLLVMFLSTLMFACSAEEDAVASMEQEPLQQEALKQEALQQEALKQEAVPAMSEQRCWRSRRFTQPFTVLAGNTIEASDASSRL